MKKIILLMHHGKPQGLTLIKSMKTKLNIALVMVLLFTSSIFANINPNFHSVFTLQGPIHPLTSNNYGVRLYDVDTVYNYFYYQFGRE